MFASRRPERIAWHYEFQGRKGAIIALLFRSYEIESCKRNAFKDDGSINSEFFSARILEGVRSMTLQVQGIHRVH
jgi:hypothetical protein